MRCGEGVGKWSEQFRGWKQLVAGGKEVSGCSVSSLIAKKGY